MTASLSDQEKFSRVDAAAYLTTKGHTMKTQSLARLASDSDDGPKFGKEGRSVFYLKADLDDWLQRHPPKANGKANGKAKTKIVAKGDDTLALAAGELVELCDALISGEGTMLDGVTFARCVDNMRRILRARR